MKPVEIEYLINNGTKATLEQISIDLIKVGTDGTQSGNSVSAAFASSQVQALLLRDVISTLEAKLQDLQNVTPNIDQTNNIAEAEALQNKIEELKTQLVQLEQVGEDTQVLPKSLPTAKKQFDSLHFSIQQMAREMPTLAMGPQMFFLAISNNLPIFTDELARAKKEYAALTAAGEKGTPVWKQVTKSLFSWQTAMTTGIMLLVMYGDEIINSISDMTGWGEAARKKKEAAEELIEAEKKMVDQAAKTITEFEALSRTWSQLGNDLSAKATFIEENSSNFDKLGVSINSVAEAENLLINNKQAFIEAQFAKAESVVLAEMAAEKYKAVFEKQQVLDQTDKAYISRKATYTDGYGTKREGTIMAKDSAWQRAEDDLAEAKKSYEDMMGQVIEKQGKYADIFKNANFNAIEDIKEGTVAWYEEQISLKQKQLKTLSVSDKEEIDAINKQIASYQAVVDSAVGKEKKDTPSEQTIDFEKELLDQRIQNRQAEIDLMAEGSDKKIAQIKFNYSKEIAEITAQEEKWKAAQGGDLTDGQTSEIEKAKQLADEKYNQSANEILQDELSAYQEYLKKFGTYQQQKYAIVQEYEDKIRSAQTDWEKTSLQSELDQYNANLETQSLKMNIDWATVFGEFGGMFNSMIEPALKDAKEYLKTDDFKNADEASKQALISAINQMEDSLGGDGLLSFKQLGIDVQNYQDSLAQLNEAKVKEIELLEQLKEAYEAYQSVLKDGAQEEIDIAKTNYDNAQTNANAASENVQSLTTTTNNFKQGVSETASTLKANMGSITDSVSQIASGSFASAYEGVVNLIRQFSSASSTAGELAESLDIPIISWILALLDALQDGLGNLISGLLDSIFNAIEGILDDILSGELFVSIAESIASGIVNILKSIVTLGGGLTWWGTDSNPDLEDTISDLMDSNERLGTKIDALADKMSDIATADATSLYEEQLALMQAQEANYQQMMSESASAWTDWGYGFLGMGGKSSSNRYIDEGMFSSDWSRISEIVGREVNSAADWWGLSSEEMAAVYNDAYDLYAKIKELADDGHEDAAQYMDDYIALYEQIEEYKEALQEKLTGISFDSVADNFKSALLEMDSDSETFADNLSSMLQTAIVDSMMATTYSEKLTEWYENFSDSMSDGVMSDAEKQALEDSYNDIVNSALTELETYKDLFGWDDSSTTQSGNSGSFETMSQDQGTKLEGLFTAAEIHLDSIDDNVVEIKDDIEEVSIQMSNATGYLKTIAENTTASKTTLTELNTTIKKMISDGLKVK